MIFFFVVFEVACIYKFLEAKLFTRIRNPSLIVLEKLYQFLVDHWNLLTLGFAHEFEKLT